MFFLKDLFTQLFKQACSLTMRNKHNSDCKQANEVRAMRDAQKKTVLWKQVRVLSWELREIIRLVPENYICLFETLEFRERLHAQSAQVNSYSQMPEILACISFEYAENYRRLKASRSITQTSYQTTTFRNQHHFVTCSDVIPLRWRPGQLDTNASKASRWCH